MIREDLTDAAEPVLTLIVAQGEKRLDAQGAFADAQDGRGTALVNAAAALAAAALALAGGSFTTLGLAAPLTIGGFVGFVGFTVAASLGLWALRSRGFHACGFYPDDFVEDIKAGKSLAQLHEDFVLELQIRLAENKRILEGRGQWIDKAAWTMIGTPFVAGLAGLITA